MNVVTGGRAPRGNARTCKGWIQEAALRMLMNDLDEEVAENPRELIVYGGLGKAARNWDAYHAIVRELTDLENDQQALRRRLVRTFLRPSPPHGPLGLTLVTLSW